MARCAAAAPSPAPATATSPAAAPVLARQVQYGRIHGFGTYTWRTNSKYVGQWKEGKMHGHGVKTDPQGTAATVRSRARGVVAVAAAGSQSGATPACTADARSSVSLGAGNIFEGEWKEGKPQLKDSKNKGLVGQHSGNTWPPRARRRPSPRPASATPSDSARGPQPLSACGGCLRPPPAPAPSAVCPFVLQADLLPWLNESVGQVPPPSRRRGGYESVMTDDPDGNH